MQEAAEAAAEHDPAQPSALPDPYSRSQSRADSSFLGPRAQIELPGLDSGNAHMYAHPDSDVLQPSSGSQQIIPALSNWQDQPNFVSYRCGPDANAVLTCIHVWHLVAMGDVC